MVHFCYAIISFFYLFYSPQIRSNSVPPVRVGIARLTHDHVAWVFNSSYSKENIEIVGIAEPDTDVVHKYEKSYGLSPEIVFNNLEEMIEKTAPEVVMAFGSTYEHLKVVQICAPRGIDVVVEKPLAVNMEQATEIARLARKYHIHVLTDYETTWYASNKEVCRIAVQKQNLGSLTKIIVRDGHQGPKEIGCSPEFLNWLTDPKWNGGGALMDFGCYGVNLATKLMKNQKPAAVWGITQRFKSDQPPYIFPSLDDEATIVLEYPHTQVIIQASWNWPFNRKDIEVYGLKGYIKAPNATEIEARFQGEPSPQMQKLSDRPEPYNNIFNYLAAVVRHDVKVKPSDLSSLENNLLVIEILDAARKSALKGERIVLK